MAFYEAANRVGILLAKTVGLCSKEIGESKARDIPSFEMKSMVAN